MSEVITLRTNAVVLKISGISLVRAAQPIVAALRAQGRRVPELEERAAVLSGSVLEIQVTLPGFGRSLDSTEALLESAVLPVADPQGLQQELMQLPLEAWAERVRQAHARTFHEALQHALQRACRATGFDRIQVGAGRIEAEDGSGRVLVVEVGVGGVVQAELLGIADGSCHRILSQWLEALRREGVIWEDAVERRWTGGRPQTSAAWSWVGRRYGISWTLQHLSKVRHTRLLENKNSIRRR